ncbi:MAG: alginate export family protein [Gemmatimonadota bacterium]
MMRHSCIPALALLALSTAPLAAQPPARSDAVTPVFTARVRAESWDWFGDDRRDEYAYPHALVRFGLEQQRTTIGWRVEFAAPAVFGAPGDATQGHGAAYVRANGGDRSPARLFAKQAFLTVGRPADGHHVRVGRFEFSEGGEVTPRDPTLAALKRRSVVQRLIGPFNFTQGARSLDGVEYGWNGGGTNITLLGAVPGVGVFNLDGWGHVAEMPLGYAAVTGSAPWSPARSEWRLFAVGARDTRGLLKSDNRPQDVRASDLGAIGVTSVGAHLLQLVATPAGPVDLAAWGVHQRGAWGVQRHRAWAADGEVGWQPRGVPLRPWLRLGLFASSGDGDPSDATHGTFFQTLATPRLYARFPFYNLTNVVDASAGVTLRPGARVTLRSDARAIRLQDAADGWYTGSGPYDEASFGLGVRPSGGARALGTLIDLSADVQLSRRWTLAAYASVAPAGRVIGDATAGRFAFLELEYRR